MNLKHRVRDFLIALFSILGIVFMYRMYIKRTGPLVRIVVFHDVADSVWFEKILAVISKKYNLITPEQFHAQEFDLQKINVLLTFDDGYQSWIDVCLPLLQKYTAKGIFFINSGLLDIRSDRQKVSDFMQKQLLISPKNPLDWEGARQLITEGHTLGGHTVTHPNLAVLHTDEASLEIIEDKQRIESMLDIEITDFAYPFGRRNNYTKETFDEVSKAGYTFVYTADTGFVKIDQHQHINRVCLEKNQSMKSVHHWIEGGYDVLQQVT